MGEFAALVIGGAPAVVAGGVGCEEVEVLQAGLTGRIRGTSRAPCWAIGAGGSGLVLG